MNCSTCGWSKYYSGGCNGEWECSNKHCGKEFVLQNKEIIMRKCPKCKSENVQTEKRPNGDSKCLSCNHSGPTLIFDQPDGSNWDHLERHDIEKYSKEEIEVLAYPLRALKREVFQGKDFESKTILECVAEIKNLHIANEYQSQQLKLAEQKLGKIKSHIFNLREEAFKSYSV